MEKQNLIDEAILAGIVLVERSGLLAPMGYWAMTPAMHRKRCNGCGPGLLRFIIPDNLFGIVFRPACYIHDYCFGCPLCSFKFSNNLFNYNLFIQVRKSDRGVRRVGFWLRARYVYFVRSFLGKIAYLRAQHERR
jgi:hypothetical protein